MDRSIKETVQVRYIFAILGCCGMAIIYGLNINLHVTMIRMINHSESEPSPVPEQPDSNLATFDVINWENTLTITNTSECLDEFHRDSKIKDGPFAWNGTSQSVILSSYFWGYTLAQFPGGRLAELTSAKWVFYFGVVLNIICTFIIPIAAKTHAAFLIVIRVIQGIGGGVTFPAMHVILSKWAPPIERGTMTGIVYAGIIIGTMISVFLSKGIAERSGWENVFYFQGSSSCIWLILWPILISDSPRKHKFISQKEREYLAEALDYNEEENIQAASPIPWKQIFTSKPFLAILTAQICFNWCWYLILLELPLFMHNMVKFRIQRNSILFAAPYFSMAAFCIILSLTLDTVQKFQIINTTIARKIATAAAFYVPTLCLIALCYTRCIKLLVVIVISITITFVGASFPGFITNHLDIAPKYAGTLMGITNTLGSVPGFVLPLLVEKLVQNDATMTPWKIIFWITAVLNLIGATVYTILGSAKQQDWNKN